MVDVKVTALVAFLILLVFAMSGYVMACMLKFCWPAAPARPVGWPRRLGEWALLLFNVLVLAMAA